MGLRFHGLRLGREIPLPAAPGVVPVDPAAPRRARIPAGGRAGRQRLGLEASPRTLREIEPAAARVAPLADRVPGGILRARAAPGAVGPLVADQLPTRLRPVVEALLARKRAGDELAQGPRIAEINEFLDREVASLRARRARLPR